MEIFGIYGASGFGREVMPIFKATNVPSALITGMSLLMMMRNLVTP